MPFWALAIGFVLLSRNSTATTTTNPVPPQQPVTPPPQQRDAGAQAADVLGAIGAGIAGILNAYGKNTNQSYQTGGT